MLLPKIYFYINRAPWTIHTVYLFFDHITVFAILYPFFLSNVLKINVFLIIQVRLGQQELRGLIRNINARLSSVHCSLRDCLECVTSVNIAFWRSSRQSWFFLKSANRLFEIATCFLHFFDFTFELPSFLLWIPKQVIFFLTNFCNQRAHTLYFIIFRINLFLELGEFQIT